MADYVANKEMYYRTLLDVTTVLDGMKIRNDMPLPESGETSGLMK